MLTTVLQASRVLTKLNTVKCSLELLLNAAAQCRCSNRKNCMWHQLLQELTPLESSNCCHGYSQTQSCSNCAAPSPAGYTTHQTQSVLLITPNPNNRITTDCSPRRTQSAYIYRPSCHERCIWHQLLQHRASLESSNCGHRYSQQQLHRTLPWPNRQHGSLPWRCGPHKASILGCSALSKVD
jgi:hypothetical protein